MSAHASALVIRHRRLALRAFVAAFLATLIAFAVEAGIALASQNWSCTSCHHVYASRSGNEYKLHGINYSRNGDVCVEVSGHGGTLRCNSNPATGSGVYWQGSKSHPVYGKPVVSTDKGDLGKLAGHSY
ncbi:MAG: hypothetical protein ACRDRD_14695 [Pseudonocardiaceae bacterium]